VACGHRDKSGSNGHQFGGAGREAAIATGRAGSGGRLKAGAGFSDVGQVGDLFFDGLTGSGELGKNATVGFHGSIW
jgi:hypothetical protein